MHFNEVIAALTVYFLIIPIELSILAVFTRYQQPRHASEQPLQLQNHTEIYVYSAKRPRCRRHTSFITNTYLFQVRYTGYSRANAAKSPLLHNLCVSRGLSSQELRSEGTSLHFSQFLASGHIVFHSGSVVSPLLHH